MFEGYCGVVVHACIDVNDIDVNDACIWTLKYSVSTLVYLTDLNDFRAIIWGDSTYPLGVLSFVAPERFSLFWCIYYPQFAVDNFTCQQGVDKFRMVSVDNF